MSKIKEGQKVKYEGIEVEIEKVYSNGTCLIVNPHWSYEDEKICVNDGVFYDVPYLIIVKPSELSEITNVQFISQKKRQKNEPRY